MPGLAYLKRLDRARDFVFSRRARALLVTTPSSIFWFTGVDLRPGGASYLVITRDSYTLLVPRLEEWLARDMLLREGLDGDVEVRVYPRRSEVEKQLKELLGESGRVLVEGAYQPSWSGLEVSDATRTIQRWRMVKEDWEVERIASAIRAAEEGLRRALEALSEGVTESEIAGTFLRSAYSAGAEAESFPPIVAFASNTQYPHWRPSSTRLTHSTPVLVDVGVRVGGYSSDMTRSFWWGSSAPSRYKSMWEAVESALGEAIDVAQPGVTAAEVDSAAARVLESAGFGKWRLYSTGHGVGIDVHEAPAIASGSDVTLEPGMVFTVEPGVHVRGYAGVRLEEVVVVTRRRAVRLTKFPLTLEYR